MSSSIQYCLLICFISSYIFCVSSNNYYPSSNCGSSGGGCNTYYQPAPRPQQRYSSRLIQRPSPSSSCSGGGGGWCPQYNQQYNQQYNPPCQSCNQEASNCHYLPCYQNNNNPIVYNNRPLGGASNRRVQYIDVSDSEDFQSVGAGAGTGPVEYIDVDEYGRRTQFSPEASYSNNGAVQYISEQDFLNNYISNNNFKNIQHKAPSTAVVNRQPTITSNTYHQVSGGKAVTYSKTNTKPITASFSRTFEPKEMPEINFNFVNGVHLTTEEATTTTDQPSTTEMASTTTEEPSTTPEDENPAPVLGWIG